MENDLNKTHEAVDKWTASLDSLKVINCYLENMQLDLPTLTASNMEEWRKWLVDIDKLPHFDYSHVDIKPFLPEIQRTSDWAQRLIDVIPERDSNIRIFGEYRSGRSYRLNLTGTPTEDFEKSLESVVASYHRISEILNPSTFLERPMRPSRKSEETPPPKKPEPEKPSAPNIAPPPQVPPPNFIETPPEVTPRPSEPQQAESPLAHELRNFSGAVTNVVLNIAAGATVHLHFEGRPEVEINGPMTAQLTKIVGAVTTSRGGRPHKGKALYSQKQMGKMVGHHEDTIARWDKGEGTPPGYSRGLRESGDPIALAKFIETYKASRHVKDAMNTKHVKHNISEEQIHRESLK